MTEIWKDIKGYKGLYEVSNLGRVRSVDRITRHGRKRKSQIRKPELSNVGYQRIWLCKDGKETRFAVHRLVAQTFIPNTENKPVVNHINEIKTDNRVENLEWVTHSENLNHGTAMQRSADKRSKAVTNGVQIFKSIMEAERVTGVHNSNIAKCLKGKRKTSGGYKWQYINDSNLHLERG